MDGKLISKGKTLLQTIKKLNTSWNHNNKQIILLFENILKLLNTLISIQNTIHSQTISFIFNQFNDLKDLLIGSILIEIEDNLLQIKQFMVILGDIEAAFKQSSLESFQILNEKKIEDVYSPQSIESSLPILDAMEAIYDVQRIQFSRSYEYKRKEKLINNLLFVSKDENKPREYDYWLKIDQLNNLLQQWDLNNQSIDNSENVIDEN